MKNCDSFLIFAQNLDCGCTLEPPQGVPSIYVLKKIRKTVYPGKPQFYNIKLGCKGVYISQTCLHDERGQMFSCIIMNKNTNKTQKYTAQKVLSSYI